MEKEAKLYPYFTSLSVENVRCFGPKQTLDLKDEDGKPARWTLILGDNGTGKTTLLKGLAMFYWAWGFDNPFIIRRFTNFGFFKRTEKKDAKLAGAFGDWQREIPPVEGNMVIGSNGASYSLGGVKFPKDILFAYGASRIINSSAIAEEKESDKVQSLFDEESQLVNAEEWLLQTLLISLTSKNGRQTYYEKKLSGIKNLLLRLFEGEFHSIQFDSENEIPKVLFQTDYGWITLHNLSLGQKTLIAWVVDLAKRMFTLYEEELEDPLSGPAIVLVDEIDLHMHPQFQRKLYKFLTEKFPNTQFIVTAHSPLIVQASQGANIALLKKEGDHVIIENNPASVKNWRVDQILTSDLFGLESARPPETEALLKERRQLLSKKKIGKKEQIRLKSIEKEIGELPVGSTPKERKAMSIVDRIAEIVEKDTSDS